MRKEPPCAPPTPYVNMPDLLPFTVSPSAVSDELYMLLLNVKASWATDSNLSPLHKIIALPFVSPNSFSHLIIISLLNNYPKYVNVHMFLTLVEILQRNRI